MAIDKLRKINTEQAREMGKVGGKSKSLRKQMNARKNCDKICPLYPCTFEPLARIKYNKKCALRVQPPEIIDRFFKIIVEKDESKFLDELSRALMRLSIKDDEKAFITYGEKLHRMLYGDKTRLQANVEGVVTINDLIKAFKEDKKSETKEK